MEVTPWRQYAGNQKQTLIPRGPNQTALSLPHVQDTHTTYINNKSVPKGMPAAQCFNVHVHDIMKTESEASEAFPFRPDNQCGLNI